MNRILGAYWGVKVGALALAIFLWLNVVTSKVYEDVVQIPLKVQCLSNTRVVAGPVPETVTVKFMGKGKRLFLLRYSDVQLILRIAGEAVGLSSYTLSTSDIVMPVWTDVQPVEIIDPTSIQVDVDVRVTKKISVEPRLTFDLSPGYVHIGPPRVMPDSVLVSGPRRFVAPLERVLLDSLHLSGLKKSLDQTLPVSVPERLNTVFTQGRIRIEPDRVRVLMEVQPRVEQWVEGVPIRLIRAPTGAQVQPPVVDVKISGGVNRLATLSPEEIRAYVDLRFLGREQENVSRTITLTSSDITLTPLDITLLDTRPSSFQVLLP